MAALPSKEFQATPWWKADLPVADQSKGVCAMRRINVMACPKPGKGTLYVVPKGKSEECPPEDHLCRIEKPGVVLLNLGLVNDLDDVLVVIQPDENSTILEFGRKIGSNSIHWIRNNLRMKHAPRSINISGASVPASCNEEYNVRFVSVAKESRPNTSKASLVNEVREGASYLNDDTRALDGTGLGNLVAMVEPYEESGTSYILDVPQDDENTAGTGAVVGSGVGVGLSKPAPAPVVSSITVPPVPAAPAKAREKKATVPTKARDTASTKEIAQREQATTEPAKVPAVGDPTTPPSKAPLAPAA